MPAVVHLRLPLPPSVNSAFSARRGTHRLQKTAAYRFWLRCVEDRFRGALLPKLDGARYGLWLELPETMRGDVDNRTKLLSDVLKTPASGGTEFRGLGVVQDDAGMRAHYVAFSPFVPRGECDLAVVAWTEWVPYVLLRLEEVHAAPSC